MRADGRWLRTYNRGRAKIPAYLEDHAFLLEASLTLYEATFDDRWFAQARELADEILERFADGERGGFFAVGADHELIARRKELEDAPIPSGGSAATFGLLRLAALTGEARYEQAAAGTIALLHAIAPQHPTAFGHLLQAIDFHLAPVKEVALAGPDTGALERAVRAEFRPHVVLAGGGGDVPLLEGRGAVDGRAAAYVCERFACQAPGDRAGRAARPADSLIPSTVTRTSPEPQFRLTPRTRGKAHVEAPHHRVGPAREVDRAAAWLGVMAVVIGGDLPAKYADAEQNESTSFLPGRRGVDQGAEGRRGHPGRRDGRGRRRLPRATAGSPTPTCDVIAEDRATSTRTCPRRVHDAAVGADPLRGRHVGAMKRGHHRRRRERHHPRPGRPAARGGPSDPGGGLQGPR